MESEVVVKRIIIVAALCIYYGGCAKLTPCHKNVCDNGGLCYKTGATTEGPLCPSGFLAYDSACYNFVQNAVAWSAAERQCRQWGARLVDVNGQRERDFLQAYLTWNLSSQEPAAWRDVWSSGKTVEQTAGGRSSGDADYKWTWTTGVDPPVSVPIERPLWFWQFGEPRPQVPLKDACLAISSNSRYSMWLAASCSTARNYFVCEKSATRLLEVEPSDTYFYQCKCRIGYYGLHCEHGPPPGNAVESKERLSCMTDPLDFYCINQPGADVLSTIKVDYVMHGMISNIRPAVCTGDVDEIDCVSENSLMLIRQRCQGRRSCKLPSFAEVFPVNPCRPGSMNFVEYRFRCDNELTQCPEGTVMVDGRCYAIQTAEVPSKRRSWLAARAKCAEFSGDLAGPVTEPVYGFLEQRLRAILAQSADPENAQLLYWIGLKTDDLATPRWFTNELMTFAPLNSTFGRRQCVAMEIHGGTYTQQPTLSWVTKPCDMPYSWICEFPPEAAPRPKLYDPDWYTRTTTDGVPTDSGWVVWPESSTLPTLPNGVGVTLPASLTIAANTDIVSQPVTPMFGVQNCSAVEARGVSWPETREDQRAVMPCPNGTMGRAEWRCQRVGVSSVRFVPATPDMSACRHAFIAQAEQDILRSRPAIDIGEKLLVDLRSKSSSLYGGDVVGSLEVLSNLVDVARQQLTSDANASRFSHVVGDVANVMLTDEVLPVWQDMPRPRRMQEATLLMNTLEDSTNLWGTYLGVGNKGAFKYSNMAMKVEVIGAGPQVVGGGSEVTTNEGMTGDAVDQTRVSFSIDDAFGQDPISGGFDDAIFGDIAPTFTLPSAATLNFAAEGRRPTISPSNDDLGGGDRDAPQDRLFPPPPAPLKLGYFVFTNLGKLLTPAPHLKDSGDRSSLSGAVDLSSSRVIVNSLVVGATVNDRRRAALRLPDSEPAVFRFRHLIANASVSNPRCVFWNTGTNAWDGSGCRVANGSAAGTTVCECTHLTSFAILMDFGGNADAVPVGSVNRRVLDAITYVGCALSCACLLVAIVVFTGFRSLWCNRNTIHRNLCICLLAATLVFLFGIDRTESAAVCTGVAVLLHYLFLAAFSWMLLEGYQLYLMLCQVFDVERPKTLVYHLLAYGFPAIVVAVSAGVASQHYGTDKYCWIDVNSPTIWAFVGPVTVVVLANIVFLVVALKVVFGVHSLSDRSIFNRIKGWTKGSAMLLCLLGVTWVFGYLMAVDRTHIIFVYIFTVLNSLQGVFIFVFHVLGNDKARIVIRRSLRRLCPDCCACSKERKTSSALNSSSFWSSGQRLRNLLNLNGAAAGSQSQSTASTGATTNPRSPISLDPPPHDWLAASAGNSPNGKLHSGDKTANGHAGHDEHEASAKATEATLLAHLEPGHLCSKHCESAQSLPQPGLGDAAPDLLLSPPVDRENSAQRSASSMSSPYHFTYIETGRESGNGKIVYRNPTFIARF